MPIRREQGADEKKEDVIAEGQDFEMQATLTHGMHTTTTPFLAGRRIVCASNRGQTGRHCGIYCEKKLFCTSSAVVGTCVFVYALYWSFNLAGSSLRVGARW